MSESVVVSGASSALTGTKNVLVKAAPWIALVAGVMVGGMVNSALYGLIINGFNLGEMLRPYTGDWTARVSWGIIGGILAAIGIALFRMMQNVIGKTIGMFLIGCSIRCVINLAFNNQGPAPVGA